MEPLSQESGVSRRTKISAYVGAWRVALVITNPSGSLAALVYMFPPGLAAFFWPPALRGDGWVGVVGCYLAYFVHAIVYFRARVARRTYVWLGVLIILLICNVAGCREMIDTH